MAHLGTARVDIFLRETGEGFEIRYFLPIGELPLVGHASLAAAHVLLKILRPGLASATLRRRTGSLRVSMDAVWMAAVTVESSGFSAVTIVAAKSLKCPRTLLTMKCRAVIDTSEWVRSAFHVPAT